MRLPTSRRVYLKSWGCQMNDYDAKRMLDLLKIQGGFEVTTDVTEADLIVLNTCSIREKAQEKLFHQLGEWRPLKEKKPELIVAVGGCVAVQEGLALRRRNRIIDVIFGPQSLHLLPQLIETFETDRKPVIQLEALDDALDKFHALPPASESGVSAFVTIMEGCDKFCAYCVVPTTRGAEVCRSMEDILKEVEHLVHQGAREIVLLGQNVNAWRTAEATFPQLLRKIAALGPLKRLRFLTSHPLELDDPLIQCFAEEPKLCDFLHLPIQSGSDPVLARMQRGYSVALYERRIAALKSVRPHLTLSSDFIVGFPGEEEHHFQETLELVARLQFDISYAFIYSPRPNTLSATWPDETPHAVKLARLHRLQRLLSAQVLAHSARWLGQKVEVLVERMDAQNFYIGRTSQNRWVRFLSDRPCIGEEVSIKLNRIAGSLLEGDVQ